MKPSPEATRVVKGDELCRLLTHLLAEGVSAKVAVTGRSMQPSVKSGDVVTLTAANGQEVKPGDVVMTRARGGMLLHRVERLNANAGEVISIATKGDACAVCDEPVAAQTVIARMTAVEKPSLSVLNPFELGARVRATGLSLVGAVARSLLNPEN